MKKVIFVVVCWLLPPVLHAAMPGGIVEKSISPALLGQNFAISRVAPRIFTPEESSPAINRVRFYYENPDNCEVTIQIFDLAGSLVRRNLERESDTVMYWDGSDKDGAVVRGGIYIYQVEAGKRIVNGTVVVSE